MGALLSVVRIGIWFISLQIASISLSVQLTLANTASVALTFLFISVLGQITPRPSPDAITAAWDRGENSAPIVSRVKETLKSRGGKCRDKVS